MTVSPGTQGGTYTRRLTSVVVLTPPASASRRYVLCVPAAVQRSALPLVRSTGTFAFGLVLMVACAGDAPCDATMERHAAAAAIRHRRVGTRRSAAGASLRGRRGRMSIGAVSLTFPCAGRQAETSAALPEHRCRYLGWAVHKPKDRQARRGCVGPVTP